MHWNCTFQEAGMEYRGCFEVDESPAKEAGAWEWAIPHHLLPLFADFFSDAPMLACFSSVFGVSALEDGGLSAKSDRRKTQAHSLRTTLDSQSAISVWKPSMRQLQLLRRSRSFEHKTPYLKHSFYFRPYPSNEALVGLCCSYNDWYQQLLLWKMNLVSWDVFWYYVISQTTS